VVVVLLAMTERPLDEDDLTCAEGFDEARYPPFITTQDERRRWRLCAGIAESIFDDGSNIWAATRSLYRSDLPTDP
jgi:hypothetical protein